MKRYASVRFGDVLGQHERESATRTLRSFGAAATSWRTTAARTYAGLEVDDRADLDALRERLPSARLDEPPLRVLRICPSHGHALPRLGDALGGMGRPSGIVDLVPDGDALVVEFDTRTAPSLVVALVDVELAAAPGRTIEPLVPLDDATLAEFAGDVLGIAALDATRIIETHTVAWLERTAP
ncbi:MAG: hypothetical protein GIW94_01125 [Candidatus Eremiobacteraeota bacterium]|nr:hypothetical protein [Candidatus Eremiobacteraeota bacterium]MBC5820863.1 hypothetical protein [Candidatus Eremiobacteraeota bacterium]